jgi:hypothetical protein
MSLPQTQVLVWSDLESRYAELQARSVNTDTVDAFLLEWSELSKTVTETGTFLRLATDLDTADQAAQEQLSHFHQVTQPAVDNRGRGASPQSTRGTQPERAIGSDHCVAANADRRARVPGRERTN